MFESKKEVKGNFNLEKVWKLYENVERWVEWDGSLEKASLEGKFIVGSSGVMTIIGMPEMPFTLIEVKKGNSFTTKSVVGPFEIEVSHKLTKLSEVSSVIEHGVTVKGPDSEKVTQIGSGIAHSFTSALDKLGALSI